MNTYRNITFPNGTQVRWSPWGYWFIRKGFGSIISLHDSREYAIRKARKIDREVAK